MAKRTAKNKGGAPEGNNNAEKWTEEVVVEKLAEMQELAKSKNYFFIGKLCVDSDVPRQVWSEWSKKFSGVEVVSDTIKNIEYIIESNLVHGSISGDYNATMSIFTLKNKHGWEDKRKTESSGPNGGPIQLEGVDLSKLTDKQVYTLQSLIEKSQDDGD